MLLTKLSGLQNRWRSLEMLSRSRAAEVCGSVMVSKRLGERAGGERSSGRVNV